jgi:hypothetical protein
VAAAKDKMIAARRLKVAQMMLRGLNQSDIARKLKVNRSTICRDQKQVMEEWKADRVELLDEYKQIQLARLERQYWQLNEAWDRSIGKVVTTTIKTGGENGEETTEKIEHHAGDPRFQSEMRSIIQEINKLLGLYPSDKLDVNHSGIPVPAVEVVIAGREEIPTLQEVIANAGGVNASDD